MAQKLLFLLGLSLLASQALVQAQVQHITYPTECDTGCAPYVQLQNGPDCSTLDNNVEDDYNCVCKDGIYITAEKTCATCVYQFYPQGLTIDNVTVTVNAFTLATYEYCQSQEALISPVSIASVASLSTASVAAASRSSVAVQESLARLSSTAAPTPTRISSSPSATTPVVVNTAKKSNTGAIVGGVVAGLGALAIAGAVFFFLMRRNRKRREGGGLGAVGGRDEGNGKGYGESNEKPGGEAILSEGPPSTPHIQPYIYSNPSTAVSTTSANQQGYSSLALRSPSSASSSHPYSPSTSASFADQQQQQQRHSMVSSSLSAKALEARRNSSSASPSGPNAAGLGGGHVSSTTSEVIDQGGVERAVYHQDGGPVVEFPPVYGAGGARV